MREEEKQISQKSKWQQLLRKKWFYPAVYLASAALILTAVMWYQGASENDVEQADPATDNYSQSAYDRNEDVVPVNLSEENVQMPVLAEEQVTVKKKFYDVNSSKEQQENALVFYNNTYRQSTGVDLALESGETFDVVAALSGTVVKVENDSLLGNVVEVEHENGVTTHYQSLKDVAVEAGAFVTQGELIGKAGRNVYNQEAGVHVHFEVRADGEPVNPEDVFNKPMSTILDQLNEEPAEEGKQDEDSNAEPSEGEDAGDDEEGNESGDAEKQPEDDDDSDDQTPDASVGMARA